MFILGINSAYHESAACLIQDGRMVAAVEEERFTRIKHAKRSAVDNAHELPWRSIDFCLSRAGIGPRDVDHVGYSLDPDRRLELNRDLPDAARVRPGDFGTLEGEQAFHRSNMEARRLLEERFCQARFHFLEHHLCHAASAYTVSPFEEAAVLAIDGIGEFYTTWLGHGRAGKLRQLSRIPYPHSLGFLWEKFSVLLGFDAYAGPGKMMGYGAITDARGELTGHDHLAAMHHIVTLKPGGGFCIDNDVMRFRTGDFTGLEDVFGPRRPSVVDRYEEASIAAALQSITEEALINLCRGLYEEVNRDREPGAPEVTALCLAGGVALNCVANDLILRRTPFSELWIQPAANDAGTALGAAAYISAELLGQPTSPMDHAFLGPSFDEAEIKAALDRTGVEARVCTNIEAEVARRLDEGQILAWFQGGLEFGPRALGHRSILADPTRFDTRQRLNTQVKMRESFRPFAPSVMDSAVERFFDMPAGTHCADYMLAATPLSDDHYSQVIPAVVQENGSTHRSTSRIHRVRQQVNPMYYGLMDEFRTRTGVGAVLNTSFNISEPIVMTPDQALATFGRSGMSCLVIGPFLVEGES